MRGKIRILKWINIETHKWHNLKGGIRWTFLYKWKYENITDYIKKKQLNANDES